MEPDDTAAESKAGSLRTMPCSQCGVPLNITGILPHTLVECSRCHAFTRTSSLLGRYHIIASLGVGGMSLVYRAKDDVLGREVALKVLNQTYSAQPERVKMFEHEAEVMARVSHPNVVKIYSVGDSEGCFYIAMELVEGSNLDALVGQEGKLGEMEGLQIALEIAEGLRAGFEAGVLHRDMKPANVLLNMRGEAQIVDFGLSLLNGDQSQEEEIWVTPHYAPPETLERLPEDFRSDIYALGATLFQIFSGRTSIEVKELSISRLLEAKKVILPLGEVNPDLSEQTCRIVDRCLKYAPEQRYDSYDFLIADIKGALVSLKEGNSRSWKQAKQDSKRKKLLQYGACAGGVCLLLGLGAFLFSGSHEQEVVDKGREQSDPTEKGISDTEKQRREQKKVAESYLAARAAFQKQDYIKAADLFTEVFHSAVSTESTAAWASLEAYISHILQGQTEQGNAVLTESLEKFSRKTGNDSLSKLMKLAESLKNGAVMDWQTCRSYGSAFSPVYFINGYRAWMAGDLELAGKCFQFSIPDGGEWEQYLGRLGKECLDDIKVLDELDKLPQTFSKDTQEKYGTWQKAVFKTGYYPQYLAAQKIEELKSLSTSQKDMEARMESEIATRSQDPMWNEGRQLLKKRNFEAAKNYFSDARSGGSKANLPLYASMARACGLAQGFLDGIAAYVLFLKKEVEVDDAREPGKKLVLTGVQSGKPLFKQGDKLVSGLWSDISTASFARLYRESASCMTAVPADKKKTMQERALNFFYLMGDRQSGREWEKNLEKEDPGFVERWKKVVGDLNLMEW